MIRGRRGPRPPWRAFSRLRESMGELTAQMIQRGRGAASGDLAQRRKIAQDMRAAREKLTSSIGLERAFDYELVRLFAQYRVGASIPLFALLAALACAATLWTPLRNSVVGFLIVLIALSVALALSQRFLRQAADAVSLKAWRGRFVLAEALQSASWVLAVQALVQVEAPGIQSFILFILVIVAAITAMLSATVPAAVYAGFAPLSAWAVGFAWTHRHVDALILAVMAVSAQVFFAVLAQRLYSSALTNFQARAEKDALFAELEQAKANSDEARRRAEEANLAKSRFLATMSHELRTPLNAILGFSEVMQGELFGPHSVSAYKEYSNDIHSSGQHLLMLINEILDLSRVEAGRCELKEESVSLSGIIEDCCRLLTLRARKRDIMISEAVEPDLPRIWADERAIRQVVLNLLSNAIKFTPQGGQVTMKLGWTAA